MVPDTLILLSRALNYGGSEGDFSDGPADCDFRSNLLRNSDRTRCVVEL